MPKVVKREIQGFEIQIKEEEEYGFVKISKGGKSIYLHICPELNGVYVNTVFKGDFKITYTEKDPLGIVLVEFGGSD